MSKKDEILPPPPIPEEEDNSKEEEETEGEGEEEKEPAKKPEKAKKKKAVKKKPNKNIVEIESPIENEVTKEDREAVRRYCTEHINMVLDGTHPQLIEGRKLIELENERKLQSVNMHYDLERIRIQQQRESEISVIGNDLGQQKLLLKAKLLENLFEQKRIVDGNNMRREEEENQRRTGGKRKRSEEKMRIMWEKSYKRMKLSEELMDGIDKLKRLEKSQIEDDLKEMGIKLISGSGRGRGRK